VCPKNEISVILRRSFLGTSNVLINCNDGKMKLTFGNMTIELNVFNQQKQPMRFDDVKLSTLNWITDFSLEQVEFNYKEESMPCIYDSFCMEHDTFAFDEPYDDLLHASILPSISLLSPCHEALPSMPSSSSLELKSFPNTLKYAFGSRKLFYCDNC